VVGAYALIPHYFSVAAGAAFTTFLQAPLWAFLTLGLAAFALVTVVLPGTGLLSAAITGAHNAPTEATVRINDSVLLFMMELLE